MSDTTWQTQNHKMPRRSEERNELVPFCVLTSCLARSNLRASMVSLASDTSSWLWARLLVNSSHLCNVMIYQYTANSLALPLLSVVSWDSPECWTGVGHWIYTSCNAVCELPVTCQLRAFCQLHINCILYQYSRLQEFHYDPYWLTLGD